MANTKDPNEILHLQVARRGNGRVLRPGRHRALSNYVRKAARLARDPLRRVLGVEVEGRTSTSAPYRRFSHAARSRPTSRTVRGSLTRPRRGAARPCTQASGGRPARRGRGQARLSSSRPTRALIPSEQGWTDWRSETRSRAGVGAERGRRGLIVAAPGGVRIRVNGLLIAERRSR